MLVAWALTPPISAALSATLAAAFDGALDFVGYTPIERDVVTAGIWLM